MSRLQYLRLFSFRVMQVRLPEDDEEVSLYRFSRPSEASSISQENRRVEERSGTCLKYSMIAGLVVVLIIILLNSSHKKIRIDYNSPMKGKEVKRTSDGNNVESSQYNPVKQNTETVKINADAKQQTEKNVKEKALKVSEELGPPIAPARLSNEQKEDEGQQPARMNIEQKYDERAPISQQQADINEQQHKIQQKKNVQRMKETIQKPIKDIQQNINGGQKENQKENKEKNVEKDKGSPPQSTNQQRQVELPPETIKKSQPNEQSGNQVPKDSKDKSSHEMVKGQSEVPKASSNTDKKQEESQQPKAPLVPQQSWPQPQVPEKLPVPQKQQQNVILQKNPNLMSTPTRGNFMVPHFVWTYSENPQSNTFFVRKCLDNMKYFASKSSFQMTVLSLQNFKTLLEPETVNKINKVLLALKDRIKKQPKSNLKDHFETIKRRLISFHVLNEKGGIFIEKNVLFTQSFEWLKEIEDNMYVNKGCGRVRARYFGFFDLDHSSLMERHNKFGIAYDTEKYMIEFPVVEPYFFVAQARQAFLTETLAEIMNLLTNPISLQQKMKKYEVNMGALQGKDLYYEIFHISQHIVLRRKQQQINSLGANKQDNNFAIDEYGLLTMNERYFPKKLDFYFQRHSEEKIYWNLAKYALKEMEDTTGPMRYITCMMFEQHINYRLQKARQKEERYYIHPQSFIGKFVISNSTQPYILREYEKGTVNPLGKIWDKLPRIIWVYWDTGLKNSSLGNKLCIDNIRRTVQNQFQVRQLNDSNSAEYIGKDLDEKINSFIKDSKIRTFAQTRSDFLRLAIIAKYGGIYMDASYFSVQGFSWIINITQVPTETIFNRYGEMPRILMYFHPHFGTAFDWTYDKRANTKRLMVSAYQSNLLIAQPNQQFFWDWFQEHGKFITTPYEQSEQLMKDLKIYGDRWTTSDNVYLAVMDSVKNVIAKKNKDIMEKIAHDSNYNGPKSAAEFYGIWSISGYQGQQKFRAHTNFDNTYYSKPTNSDNVFLWRYSDNYVRGVIGKVSGLIKLYGWNIKYINNFLLQSYDSNFTSDLHPLSYFAKYLYNPYWHKITRHGDQLQLQFLKP